MNYYIITYKNKPLGESGESCKSNYDLRHACDFCGTGAELVDNLRVRGFSNTTKDFFMTLDGDYIISKRIFEKIKRIQPNFKLMQVQNYKNELLNFYHLKTNKVLPKCDNKSTGYVIEGQCKQCERNGYFNHAVIGNLEKNTSTVVYPIVLKYKKNDFVTFNNELILKTWECVGLSNTDLKVNFWRSDPLINLAA